MYLLTMGRPLISLQLAWLPLLLVMPQASFAADYIEDELRTLGPGDYAVIWITGRDRTAERSVERLIESAAWKRTLGNHATLAVRADDHPSLTRRLAVRELPTCVVLAAGGDEVGRVAYSDDRAALCEQLERTLRAATTYEEHRRTGEAQDPNALYWIGYFHWNRSERFQALESFHRFTSAMVDDGVDPELRAQAFFYQGEDALETGRYADATRWFDQALRLTRDGDRAARFALGRACGLRRLGRVGEAIEVIDRQLNDPISAESSLRDRLLFTAAYLHLDLGKLSQARERFADCGEVAPTSTYGRRASQYLDLEELRKKPSWMDEVGDRVQKRELSRFYCAREGDAGAGPVAVERDPLP